MHPLLYEHRRQQPQIQQNHPPKTPHHPGSKQASLRRNAGRASKQQVDPILRQGPVILKVTNPDRAGKLVISTDVPTTKIECAHCP